MLWWDLLYLVIQNLKFYNFCNYHIHCISGYFCHVNWILMLIWQFSIRLLVYQSRHVRASYPVKVINHICYPTYVFTCSNCISALLDNWFETVWCSWTLILAWKFSTWLLLDVTCSNCISAPLDDWFVTVWCSWKTNIGMEIWHLTGSCNDLFMFGVHTMSDSTHFLSYLCICMFKWLTCSQRWMIRFT